MGKLDTISVDTEVKYEAVKGYAVDKYIQVRVETTMSETHKKIVFNLTKENLETLLKTLEDF